MKTFRTLLSEVAQPLSADERRFKAKHRVELQDYPSDEESNYNMFKGGNLPFKEPRMADRVYASDVYESSMVKKGTKVVYGVKINGKVKHKKAKVEDIKNGKIYLDSSAILYDQDQVTNGKIEGHHDFYIEAAFDADLDDNKKIVVQGVKGMKSRPFKKKFRNMAAYEKWIDSDAAGDFEVQYVMNEEETTFKKIAEKYAKSTKKTDDGDGMDPVGKGDADIDNDGDVDNSDKYLHKRRKAISKNMKKESSLEETQSNWRVEVPESGIATVKGATEDQALKRALRKLKISPSFHNDYVHGKRRKNIKIVKEANIDLSEAAKIACLKCDEVSTAAAWKKNDGFCPKCKVSSQGVAENTIHEAKMENSEILAAAKKLAANGKNAKTKEFGQGLVDFYEKNKSFTPDQVAGLQNIMKNASFQLAKESLELDEISKKTRQSYLKKASSELDKDWDDTRKGKKGLSNRKVNNRFKGMDRANREESAGAFITKAAAAKRKDKKKFSMGDDEYPVTIKDKNAKKVLDEATSMDGDKIKVGDGVGFKDGYEQYGKVTKISGSTVHVSVYDSDTGDRNEIRMDARRLWVESMDESVNLSEAFKSGTLELKDGSKVKVSKEDAKLLNDMIKDLSPKNKREMQKVAMTDEAGFEEIVGFAREAL